MKKKTVMDYWLPTAKDREARWKKHQLLYLRLELFNVNEEIKAVELEIEKLTGKK